MSEATTHLTTLHRERLAGAGLAVGEDADVVAVRTALRKKRNLFKHLGLR